MQILALDVGGSHVKLLVTGQPAPRKFVSGPSMTAEAMAAGVRKAAADWKYEAISIGYPGPVLRGKPVAEPHNLGPGWVGFDFEAAFGCPVKLFNDAAMQALGSYLGGKMLFLGLGTGLGSTMIVDGIVEPMELGHLPYRKKTYEDYVGIRGLKRLGKKKWQRYVNDVVARLAASLQPDYIVLGGGNVARLKELPPNCRVGENANAFRGGFLLWEEAGQRRVSAATNGDRPQGEASGGRSVLMDGQLPDIGQLGSQLRIDSIRCTTAAGSGHPTSSMSAADLMAVLLSKFLKYDWDEPGNPNNDRLIFSKGHASPLLYAMYKAAGVISDEELLSLRKFGSRLEGHPKPLQNGDDQGPHGLPWVDVATGSLGQGLPTGVGMALAGKYVDKLPFHVWVLLGDSEMAEGSVWEAFETAGYYQLHNVTAILDMNRLGQRGPTELGWNAPAYAARARAFGWHAIEIDGHDVAAVERAYEDALAQTEKPTLIVAKTVKGSGVALVANKEGWHGKALNAEQAQEAIKELGGERHLTVRVAKPDPRQPAAAPAAEPLTLPAYELGAEVATRKAFGDALVAVGTHRPALVVLDGEVANSTFTDEFHKAFPDRFFEIYIAEQQLVSTAVGLSVLRKIAFAATFGAFFTRAFDQIRMAAVSGTSVRLTGSHVGVSIGEDGPSQMALEDLAMMQAVHGSTVLYPCDANQTVRLVDAMADLSGISYLRTTREKTPVLYAPDETFPVGGSKTLRQSDADRVAIIAAGITVHESLRAYQRLQSEGIRVRVIDAYSIKPIDKAALHEAAQATGGRLVVVEDHWVEGGLGDAVLNAFVGVGDKAPTVVKLAVHSIPGSGTPAELLGAAGIDAQHIAQAVRDSL
jgi:transketolase